jgi:hypothetical protein
MQLEKLQLDLHPRPNAQALDLGFSLLRANAATLYKAWLALWLPLVSVCALLSFFFSDIGAFFLLIAWWLRPLLERVLLYILSRQVFGESVTWQDAVRAWPKQLGGGWFRLLTWWRVLMPSRGLYQPIWQLEGARGKVAASRRAVIGKNTNGSAMWFGIVCAHFEVVIQFGFLAFIGIFASDDFIVNPFVLFVEASKNGDSFFLNLLTSLAYAISIGIIAPVYVACCFTLYLNRRASLEAWDIEIVLRQIKAPEKSTKALSSKLTHNLMLCVILFSCVAITPKPVFAAQQNDQSNLDKCEIPKWKQAQETQRLPDQSIEQKALREKLTVILNTDDFRGYRCEERWILKNQEKKPDQEPLNTKAPDLAWLANLLQILLIAAGILLIAWFFYRYRDKFPSLLAPQNAARAIEVAGLDIRPESLPKDVVGTALGLWNRKQYREATGLLYRASLAQIVSTNDLPINKGATEGDCLRLFRAHFKTNQISSTRLETFTRITQIWLLGAYGNRWPLTEHFVQLCTAWNTEFAAIPEQKMSAS